MTTLPIVPVKHADFLSYIQSHPNTPIEDLVKPYNAYDAVARKIYAQEPSHSIVNDNYANIVPLYDANGSTNIQTRARDLASESPEVQERYILPLKEDLRRPNGSPAVVPTLAEFQEHFALFTENSLSEMDWSNVVAAGSAVVTSALPVPEEYRGSKRSLREYYHEKFAPASDVDLFLYGLTEEQAIEKIKQIELSISNSILYETTTIRTKNTVTIASQYPNRHVQIVLRIYHSISEMLTGFDVDCSCAAYDGRQVYASPRAVASYITQINQIDLTRRSPSYENRLSKYSHRGFEVFWPQLDRTKIDPTIFERSFARTEGLARLLVLEKLPQAFDRDSYLQKRREERGRPPVNLYLRRRQGRQLRGNIKNDWEDEVPEWQEEDAVSNYHTFSIPYGPRFNAKKIEKLLYTKDLLLNAKWNIPKDRTVYIHRHPAFFGEAKYIIGDCCGFCPVPTTDEEIEIAKEESKIYISGNLTFIKDDPGRQEIGSFNPITDTDWTEMAYIGHTERLCQAIVSGNLEDVKSFLADENANPDRRDITGRTPLQLACMSSTPEIVQCIVDSGARMIARMADGKTALHLAAARGSVEIIRILLTKSNENEEEEAKLQEARKKEKRRQLKESKGSRGDENEDSEEEMRDADDVSRTSASFVKIDEDGNEVPDLKDDEENTLEPDIYDINVVAWDSIASPLHLAIMHGHTPAVKELVSSFGADVLLPVKISNEYDRSAKAGILNLALALSLPPGKAREMSEALLSLGASVAQSDLSYCTPLHYIAQSEHNDLFDLYKEYDGPALERAINHMAMHSYNDWGSGLGFFTPLMTAIAARNATAAAKLLELGSKPDWHEADLVNALKLPNSKSMTQRYMTDQKRGIIRPVFYAIENEMPLVAVELLRRGADQNSAITVRHRGIRVETALTQTRKMLEARRELLVDKSDCYVPWDDFVIFEKDDEAYLAETPPNSYTRHVTEQRLKGTHRSNKLIEMNAQKKKAPSDEPGREEKREAIFELIQGLELLEKELLSRGAQTSDELNKELDPTFVPNQPPNNTPSNYAKIVDRTRKKFEVKFDFNTNFLTDETRDGYRQLFDAAWRGDLLTIKKMTLATWGPSGDQAPLEIAVCDKAGLSCFSIAIFQGHLALAEAIIQIGRAQWDQPKPEPRRFEIDSDAESDDEDGGLNIISHIVDETFTHDNIGEISNKVKSKLAPLNILQQNCKAHLFIEDKAASKLEFYNPENRSGQEKINDVFEYAVFKNDIPLLELLLRLREDCTKLDNFVEPAALNLFQLAMKLGRTECLAKMIQLCAAGLPLSFLAEQEAPDDEDSEKPDEYPGLSIRGKKREDWANGGQVVVFSKNQPSPLLVAAMQGNLAVTEWFLGTAPGRHYLDYLSSHADDKRVRRIAKSKFGLEGSVLNWLQTRNNLVLHCAIFSRQNAESDRLVQWLIEQHPECLEVRSQEGYTPLSLAFLLRRTSYAKMLIIAGANQTTRDTDGGNLLHSLLIPRGRACQKVKNIAPLIDLIDKQLIATMLIQRAGKRSITPFARWMENVNGNWKIGDTEAETNPAAVAKLVLDLAESSGQKHLELLDASGNTPVHEAVKKNCPAALEVLLDRRPDLLYRENATGSTPLELTVDLWINSLTRDPIQLAFSNTRSGRGYHRNGRSPPKQRNDRWMNITSRPGWHFLPDADFRNDVEKMYQICQDRAQSYPGNRKLASLHEANEVAKRLAANLGGDRYTGSGPIQSHFNFAFGTWDVSREDEVAWLEKFSWFHQNDD